MSRSYRIQHRTDFISGFDFRLLLTGPAIGGYADQCDSFGGKFLHEAEAHQAGRIFVETGLRPCHQTEERIEAERHRAMGRVRRAA